MLETAVRPLVGEARQSQPLAYLLHRAPYPMLLGHPVGDLLGAPGPAALADSRLDRSQDRRREGRLLAGMGGIRQGVETAGQKAFDPVADADLGDLQVAGNLRDTPA